MGWLAILGCVSIAGSVAIAPSWTSLLAGAALIVAFGLLGRSLLKATAN
jgi:hypothetical protein